MSSHRFLFYCAEADASSRAVRLTGTEHHHFARVLRGEPDETLLVTNGRGVILECRVAAVGRSFTDADVRSVLEDRAPEHTVTLALAVIRREKFERAFEQCVELGITRCLPFVCTTSSAGSYSARFLERLHKVAVSAAKQSFRSFVPPVDEPVGFEEMVREAHSAGRLVVGRQGRTGNPPPGDPTMIVVGPEAGFTDSEYEALEAAGAVYVSVSPNRLRSETAAVALVAAVCGGG